MPGRHAIAPGAGKACDPRDCVASKRALRVTPHVARNTAGRRARIDRRPTRHPGYAISQPMRKRIEMIVGWARTTGGLGKSRHRGTARVDGMLTLAGAASGCPNSSPPRHQRDRCPKTHAPERHRPWVARTTSDH